MKAKKLEYTSTQSSNGKNAAILKVLNEDVQYPAVMWMGTKDSNDTTYVTTSTKESGGNTYIETTITNKPIADSIDTDIMIPADGYYSGGWTFYNGTDASYYLSGSGRYTLKSDSNEFVLDYVYGNSSYSYTFAIPVALLDSSGLFYLNTVEV